MKLLYSHAHDALKFCVEILLWLCSCNIIIGHDAIINQFAVIKGSHILGCFEICASFVTGTPWCCGSVAMKTFVYISSTPFVTVN